jgi:hypothetical protein
MFLVRTLLLCAIILVRIFTCPSFTTTYNTLEALVRTWSPHFVPFLDEEQWESYDGPRYVADKDMMWKKRGPRRRSVHHGNESSEIGMLKKIKGER